MTWEPTETFTEFVTSKNAATTWTWNVPEWEGLPLVLIDLDGADEASTA